MLQVDVTLKVRALSTHLVVAILSVYWQVIQVAVTFKVRAYRQVLQVNVNGYVCA